MWKKFQKKVLSQYWENDVTDAQRNGWMDKAEFIAGITGGPNKYIFRNLASFRFWFGFRYCSKKVFQLFSLYKKNRLLVQNHILEPFSRT